MAKIIGVVNEKGGVGKSTVCFNLAWELMKQGRKVLVVDLDGQRANLTFIAGIHKPSSLTTMFDVLAKGQDIRKAVLVVEDTLHIVPAHLAVTLITAENSSIERMKTAMDTVKDYYDYILIDVPPTPGRTHALTMAVSDFILVVMNPDITSMEANMGIVETVRAAQSNVNPDLKILGFVLNRYTKRPLLFRGAAAAVEKMAAKYETKVFNAKIRNAVAISEAVGNHEGVSTTAPKSNGAEDFHALAIEFEREVSNNG